MDMHYQFISQIVAHAWQVVVIHCLTYTNLPLYSVAMFITESSYNDIMISLNKLLTNNINIQQQSTLLQRQRTVQLIWPTACEYRRTARRIVTAMEAAFDN